MTTRNKVFIQIGATRDGLDPYLSCAKKHNMKSVLIETPDYLDLRKELLRQKYDEEIAIKNLLDVNEIISILSEKKEDILLILPGFDCYVPTAYGIAKQLNVLPCKKIKNSFNPIDKNEQRKILSNKAQTLLQPHYKIIDFYYDEKTIEENFNYPLVVKPINGAGGLGVYLVNNKQELLLAIKLINELKNYNGSKFDKIIIEEYVNGTEMSIQGICYKGFAYVLTFCEKIIKIENINTHNKIKCFREAGHIAQPGNHLSADLHKFVQDVTCSFNYHTGPFHIDFIVNEKGPYFLEIGFRLSGGALAELVYKTTGKDWANLSFLSHLGENVSRLLNQTEFHHNYLGLSTIQTTAALEKTKQLAKNNNSISIQTIQKNICTIAKEKPLSMQLAADLTRHGSSLARIWVNGTCSNDIIKKIKTCQNI